MTSGFQDLYELLAWQHTHEPFIVDGSIILDETKALLYAAPKLMKSILAQQIAICVASGEPFLGFNTTQSKVLLLQSEIPSLQLQRRLYKMQPNGQVPAGWLKVRTDRNFKLDRQTDVKNLRLWLGIEQPKLLILDPWYKMLSVEDNKTYSKTQDVMDTLIDDFHISILMVHHTTVPQFDNRQGTYIATTRPRGPQTVEGWYDSIIQMQGNLFNDDRVLTFELRHSEVLVPPLPIRVDRSKLWAFRR